MIKLIQISNINKSFNKRCVLKNISFDIEQGKCIALIGKNGAGKSTLIDILIVMLMLILVRYLIKTSYYKVKIAV